jgi:hypothetical protein
MVTKGFLNDLLISSSEKVLVDEVGPVDSWLVPKNGRIIDSRNKRFISYFWNPDRGLKKFHKPGCYS